MFLNEKKSRWWQLVSNPRQDVVFVFSLPLYLQSYHSAEGEGLFQIYKI